MTDQRRAALKGKMLLISRDKPPRAANVHGPSLSGWPASGSIAYDGRLLCVRYLDASGRPVAVVPAFERFN